MKIRFIHLAALALILGCSGSSTFPKDANEKWNPRYKAYLGVNKGGIAENTDFSSTPDVAVDAMTGATKLSGNIGAHASFPIRKNAVETGLNFMYNSQTFTYNDADRGFKGTRELGVSQIMIPLTYNIGLFRNSYYGSLFYLKLGYLAQVNFLNVEDSDELPFYTYNRFSGGLTMGIEGMPISLKNGSKIGFYFDMYRGSKMYDDFYNSNSYEMPGTSYYKTGIIFQL